MGRVVLASVAVLQEDDFAMEVSSRWRSADGVSRCEGSCVRPFLVRIWPVLVGNRHRQGLEGPGCEDLELSFSFLYAEEGCELLSNSLDLVHPRGTAAGMGHAVPPSWPGWPHAILLPTAPLAVPPSSTTVLHACCRPVPLAALSRPCLRREVPSSARWLLKRLKILGYCGIRVSHTFFAYPRPDAISCTDTAPPWRILQGSCRVDAMLSAPTGPELKFGFIKHPDDPPCPPIEMRSDIYRTIGRSEESSIKFVTIHGFVQLLDFSRCTLKVWSLSPDEDMSRCTKRFLCLGSLVEQDEFKKAGLPTDMVPMYPSLSAEEEDIVYIMLGEYKKCCRAHRGTKNRCNGYIPAAKNPRYHLRVDMRRGVLLASARLPDPMSPSVCIASTSVVPSAMI
ncbi:hypothetical protein ACQ4PT_015553 [Festuca glaucescens]